MQDRKHVSTKSARSAFRASASAAGRLTPHHLGKVVTTPIGTEAVLKRPRHSRAEQREGENAAGKESFDALLHRAFALGYKRRAEGRR